MAGDNPSPATKPPPTTASDFFCKWVSPNSDIPVTHLDATIVADFKSHREEPPSLLYNHHRHISDL
ncbi:hypothetical protein HanIR_Chr14g0709091 [Helianthus annuus]|nr:hypothetical protein HanIR_Chr14g0709091 [Helianthus annuus]